MRAFSQTPLCERWWGRISHSSPLRRQACLAGISNWSVRALVVPYPMGRLEYLLSLEGTSKGVGSVRASPAFPSSLPLKLYRRDEAGEGRSNFDALRPSTSPSNIEHFKN